MEIQEPDPSSCSQISVKKIIGLFLILIFLFSSCSKKKQVNILNQNSDNREKLARYSDIPIPLGYDFLDVNENVLSQNKNYDSDYLCFSGVQDLDESLKFYLENMEIFGWDIKNFSNQIEVLLVCSKPTRSCVISIRDEFDKSKKTKICIFVNKDLKKEDNKIRNTERDIVL